MFEPMFLTLNEVVERYRGRNGTLRNWRSMKSPTFVHNTRQDRSLPLGELDRWDRRNLIVCRPFRAPLIDDVGKYRVPSSITQNERAVPKSRPQRKRQGPDVELGIRYLMGSSIADKDAECTRVFVTIEHENPIPNPYPGRSRKSDMHRRINGNSRCG